ncbi:shikimate dehydrogenase family protein [Aquimarina agarivorans]|uniref:shikimate dehydrogenase family protein n=1 Tax=Aquimarina agarivorans TaxID=980584 RepID=UPI000248EDA1|nr:shikimate dehydrogenase [Aquimarina agarivorans]
MKKTYGLLGKNISYSFSASYFKERFEKEKINASYQNFDLQNINELREVLKTNKLHGLNVTIPYKQDVFPFLKQLDPIAQTIGAVNVIKFENDGSLTGYNSDFYGFKNSLLPLLKEIPKKALILGTGGASKAVAYALKSLDIDYTFVSRNKKENQYTYEELNQQIIKNNLLIINCTPLGTFPNVDACPNIPYEFITNNHVLYDLIYNPAETTFLKKGAEKNAITCNGLQMLILQAEKSYEIWNS